MSRIALEDNFTDIINKAQRGLFLTDTEVATRAGVSKQQLAQARAGLVDEPALRKIAAALQLSPGALVQSARSAWYPNRVELNGLAQFTTRYHDMTVNAYLVWSPSSREGIAFDTGSEAVPMLEFVKTYHIAVKLILLTHSHTDHINDLDRLKKETGAPAFICEAEPVRGAELFAVGRTFSVGPFQVSTRKTSGHSVGGTSYLVPGLAAPVVVVGDALFAGSVGGGMVSYADALANNRQQIISLPDSTVICPGHGPLTTVGEEKAHNPFFPEFKKD